MRKILLGITVLLFMVSIGYCQDQPLKLTIKSDKQVYEAGEDIWIQVTIRNVSERKQILYWLSFMVSSDNIRRPIHSPVKFSDNTPDDFPYLKKRGTLRYQEKRVLKYNLYNLKWDEVHDVMIESYSSQFGIYIRPGKYSIYFTSTIKDYTSGHRNFNSNTITLEVVEKKERRPNPTVGSPKAKRRIRE